MGLSHAYQLGQPHQLKVTSLTPENVPVQVRDGATADDGSRRVSGVGGLTDQARNQLDRVRVCHRDRWSAQFDGEPLLIDFVSITLTHRNKVKVLRRNKDNVRASSSPLLPVLAQRASAPANEP